MTIPTLRVNEFDLFGVKWMSGPIQLTVTVRVVVTTREVEADVDFERLSRMPQLEGLTPLNRILLPETEKTWSGIVSLYATRQ